LDRRIYQMKVYPMRTRWLLSLAASALLPVALSCRNDAESPTEPVPATPEAAVSATAALAFWQVSAGGGHSCGVTTDHRAYCWGFNFYGQLGDGTFTSAADRLRPVAVIGGLRFLNLSLGSEHTCGVTTDYQAYCWGHNFFGQLGDGTNLHRAEPVAVAGGHQFRWVQAGQLHTCGLSYPDNRAYCWGNNDYGQLGAGPGLVRLTPVAVSGGRAFRLLSAGVSHTCAVTMTYQTFCWGRNQYGQLGDGTTDARFEPRLVAGGHLFSQVSAGQFHTCAVTTNDRAFCWGDGRRGQIGDGYNYVRLKPQAVAGGLSFGRVSAGLKFTCGETNADRVYCWGSNRYGQLGDGTTIFRRTPRAVAGGLTFKEMSAGYYHACGKTSASVGYCWGRNIYGQLGDGTTTQRLRPVRVASPQ
jgi:alpha-tubulin suppressor-like RCC1 family protein